MMCNDIMWLLIHSVMSVWNALSVEGHNTELVCVRAKVNVVVIRTTCMCEDVYDDDKETYNDIWET